MGVKMMVRKARAAAAKGAKVAKETKKEMSIYSFGWISFVVLGLAACTGPAELTDASQISAPHPPRESGVDASSSVSPALNAESVEPKKVEVFKPRVDR